MPPSARPPLAFRSHVTVVVSVRDLVRKPGDRWHAPGAPWDVATTTATDADGVPLVATFKNHGWRPTHVVATWPCDQEELLLLGTTDRPDAEALDCSALLGGASSAPSLRGNPGAGVWNVPA
jgi:hypothetical protein